ncbi:MAG: HPr-rel-A system PqqD family peptide chaperone [Gammaproteobacteria bacterium]|nr:HPr-rel-A system PqqD family peptide chaperone [Gammaproteobacteria bacterium]
MATDEDSVPAIEREVWRITDFDILWRHWGDEHVIYSAGSGDTLLLNEVGARLLRLLLDGPVDVATLIHRVAPTGDEGDSEDMELRFAVKRTLSLFLNYGLITRVQ